MSECGVGHHARNEPCTGRPQGTLTAGTELSGRLRTSKTHHGSNVPPNCDTTAPLPDPDGLGCPVPEARLGIGRQGRILSIDPHRTAISEEFEHEVLIDVCGSHAPVTRWLPGCVRRTTAGVIGRTARHEESHGQQEAECSSPDHDQVPCSHEDR
jgi:hypothetical protein